MIGRLVSHFLYLANRTESAWRVASTIVRRESSVCRDLERCRDLKRCESPSRREATRCPKMKAGHQETTPLLPASSVRMFVLLTMGLSLNFLTAVPASSQERPANSPATSPAENGSEAAIPPTAPASVAPPLEAQADSATSLAPSTSDLENNPELAPQDVPAPLSPAEQKEYFELLTVFADTLDQVERNYVKEVSRRELMEAAIQGVLSKLDEYSDFIPPAQLDSFRTGVESEFGGIGIRVGLIDGKLTVITPLLNTPAYRADIRSGDQILKIGDAPTEGMTLEDAIQRMKGRIGTTLDLTVRHSTDTTPVTVSLQRELVRMETVMGVRRQPDNRWYFLQDETRKIAYIRITSFSRQTFDDLKQVLTDLQQQGMRGLILDLRFNPGGLLSSAIQVADLFLSEGAIVSTVGRNIASRTWNARKEDSFEGFPMVVLVNRYSASASEIVAACLQDHERAIVIGERTWGKGSVQNIIELEGGHSALKLTTAGYQRPSGKNIHRFEGATEDDEWGVKPNDGYVVPLSPADHRRLLSAQQAHDILAPSQADPASASAGEREATEDPQLEKALSYLRDELAKK